MKKNVPVDEIGPLLERNRGNVAAVARHFGVSRGTILNRVNESSTLQKVLADARESMIDDAESVLYNKVLDGSTPELLFFLKTQGRKRGYIERESTPENPDHRVHWTKDEWLAEVERRRKEAEETEDMFGNHNVDTQD